MLLTNLSTVRQYEEDRYKYARPTPRKLQKIRSRIWKPYSKTVISPTSNAQQPHEMPEIISENRTQVRKLKKRLSGLGNTQTDDDSNKHDILWN